MKQDLISPTVVEHESVLAFRDDCLDWLSQEEVINHSVISLSDALYREAPIYAPPFLFFHAAYAHAIQGCAIYAEPDGLVLSEFSPDMTPFLFAQIGQKIELPSRIFGPRLATLQIAELFAASRVSTFRIQSTWRTHILETASILSEPAPGFLRSAAPVDYDLIRAWGTEYDREKPANLSIEKFLLNKFDEGNLFFWVDRGPVCLATMSGMSCSGPRISAVYSPPEMRGNGYASTLVHELGMKFLSSGRPYMTLSTQVGDPAERIYQKLGYRPVDERISVVFG